MSNTDRVRKPASEVDPSRDVSSAADDWRSRALGRSDSVRKTQERVLVQTRRLIDAARELYDESIGTEFTVQQLVDRAGMSLQTFYRYFKSKDDLLLAVFETTVQDSSDRLFARYGAIEDPVLRLQEYTVSALLRVVSAHRGGYILTVITEQVRLSKIYPDDVARAYQPYRVLLEQCLRDGVRVGVMNPPESPELAADVLGTLVSGLYRDFGVGASPDPQAKLAAAWLFICAALGIKGDVSGPVKPSRSPRASGGTRRRRAG